MNAGQWTNLEKELNGTGIKFNFNDNLARKIIDLAPMQKKFDALKAEYSKDVQSISKVVDDYLKQVNRAKPLTDQPEEVLKKAKVGLENLRDILSKVRDTI